MSSPDAFRPSIRPLLVFGQIAGVMPLRGIFGHRGRLRFTWTNPMHLYQLAVSVVCIFFDSAFTPENLKRDFAIDSMASTVFYTVCLITTVLFLRVGRRLPEIESDFLEIEARMSEHPLKKRLGLRIKLFLVVFVALATVEHGTMGVLHLHRALSGNGTEGVGQSFYTSHFPSVSFILPYSVIMTIVLTWANAICTFNWNFVDFFLIGMSLEVSAKFDQITWKLQTLEPEEAKNCEFWSKAYDDYSRIARLTKKLDRVLSGIIITSFFSNLYHLSLQLLRSLTISGSLFHKLYFYFSLSYLILRLLSTLFCMANVNEAGKGPKDHLLAMPEHCTASVRLLERVLTDDIHWTGNRIFTINRSFVVSVIGTIITYQVVLLQFNSLNLND